jgi:hypothetical protein
MLEAREGKRVRDRCTRLAGPGRLVAGDSLELREEGIEL